MFFGEFEHTLDEKGRVFLPARHREALGETVMLARGLDGQLNVYPIEAWRKAAEAMVQCNQARSAMRDISRVLFAASECQVDRQGRIVVPPPLRKHAALATDIVIVGVDDHLEIWSRERWDLETDRLLTDGSRMADQMAEFGVRL